MKTCQINGICYQVDDVLVAAIPKVGFFLVLHITTEGKLHVRLLKHVEYDTVFQAYELQAADMQHELAVEDLCNRHPLGRYERNGKHYVCLRHHISELL